MAIDPSLITTIRTGELPPAVPTLASKIPHEIGTDLNYFTIEQLVTFLQPYVATFQHEVKILHVDQSYIDDNFDETGLGINLCLGWALMNGENGTDNVDGTFSMAYGAVNNTIGQTGGSRNAVVVSHTHASTGNTNLDFGSGDGVSRQRATAETGGVGDNINISVATEGVSGVDKNLPPFRIEIHMIKL